MDSKPSECLTAINNLGQLIPAEYYTELQPWQEERCWVWKGGVGKRDYRKVITKEQCASCGAELNLGIHHKNFDHYDDHPDNLQVLCVSCHSSVHKQSYWDAIHAGTIPPRSNGPSGWERKPAIPGQIGKLRDK